MIRLRLASVVLMGAALVGCGPSSPDNQAGPANSVTTRIMPEPVAAPVATGSATQNDAVSTPPEPPRPAPPPPVPSKRIADTASTYQAIGTEPFWAVTVRGLRATLDRPGSPPAHFAVTRSDDARAVRYQGDGITMTLDEGPCSDGMSDALWSDRVQIAFADGTLKGCGGERDDMRKDAP